MPKNKQPAIPFIVAASMLDLTAGSTVGSAAEQRTPDVEDKDLAIKLASNTNDLASVAD